LQKAITEEQVLNAPMIAEPIGLFDCCGVSDGAACAIVTTPEIARSMGKKDLVKIKALQLSTSMVKKLVIATGTVPLLNQPVLQLQKPTKKLV